MLELVTMIVTVQRVRLRGGGGDDVGIDSHKSYMSSKYIHGGIHIKITCSTGSLTKNTLFTVTAFRSVIVMTSPRYEVYLQ